MDEDVADAFKLPGRNQRPAVKQLPDGYRPEEGVGFVGRNMVSCCSSSSDSSRGRCDSMCEEDLGFQGIGGHVDLPNSAREAGCVTFNPAYRM